ncbi:MAG: hypothetical protein BroJett012_08020 [Betaproteobacteria bacterium]|nr:MAG: hypothetical protein BroJett012_08020 [Betaproteobacteria bacterium]
MGAPALVPVGSRWKAGTSDRVWVVLGRKPFGKLEIQEEGRAYFGETYQRMFLESHTRLPDKTPNGEAQPRAEAGEARCSESLGA